MFVGNECRGFAERTESPIDGSHFYMLMVYSNAESGEKLTFKHYNSETGGVATLVGKEEELKFRADMRVGNAITTYPLHHKSKYSIR